VLDWSIALVYYLLSKLFIVWSEIVHDAMQVPPPPIQGYGMSPNLTSWGGNFFLGPDGQYHLWVGHTVGSVTT
jgi:hypothetical protein